MWAVPLEFSKQEKVQHNLCIQDFSTFLPSGFLISMTLEGLFRNWDSFHLEANKTCTRSSRSASLVKLKPLDSQGPNFFILSYKKQVWHCDIFSFPRDIEKERKQELTARAVGHQRIQNSVHSYPTHGKEFLLRPPGTRSSKSQRTFLSSETVLQLLWSEYWHTGEWEYF